MIEAAKMLEDQKNLERFLREETISRYNRLHDKAQKRGDYSDTHTGRAVINHVIQPFEGANQAFVDADNDGKPWPRSVVPIVWTILSCRTSAESSRYVIVRRRTRGLSCQLHLVRPGTTPL